MGAEETETLAELRDGARVAYDHLTGSLQALSFLATKEMHGTARQEAYDFLNLARNQAVLLHSFVTDTWQAAEVEAERYHRLREELEDAATNA